MILLESEYLGSSTLERSGKILILLLEICMCLHLLALNGRYQMPVNKLSKIRL